MIKLDSKLILASSSPRRKQILNQANLSFDVIPGTVDEKLNIGLKPSEFVRHYAKEKSRQISIKHPDKLVIGADTIVSIKNTIIGKPKNKLESFRTLKKLSGQTHKVFTGVSIQSKNKKIDDTFYEVTQVSFDTLSDKLITYYIDNFNTLDKAGSYGIQDWFSVCIKKIDGCYYNVMGLPISSLYKKLLFHINDKSL